MKNLAKCIIVIALLLNVMLPIKAQNDNSEFLPIAVVAARQQNVPETANRFIEDKLHQVVSQNGLGSADYFGRFILTASIVPVTKDVLAGPPKQFSENIDVTFYIVDNIDKKIYSSTTVSAKAVNASEEKVLNSAIRSIRTNSKQITDFVNTGREKIVAYYSSQADLIIAKANTLAKERKYEAAFYELSAIPDACGSAYIRAIASAAVIYQEYVDYMGELNLAKAKSAWTANQNALGAAEAGEYLCNILPDAKCYERAESLYKEIKSKVLDDWKFEMSVYKDGISIENARIEAWKQIGVAYGTNQQEETTNVTWLVR